MHDVVPGLGSAWSHNAAGCLKLSSERLVVWAGSRVQIWDDSLARQAARADGYKRPACTWPAPSHSIVSAVTS